MQLTLQVYSLFGQTEGCKKGSHIVRLPPRALGYHRKWKSLSFWTIWNIPISPLFFIRPLTSKHCMTWSSVINLWKDSGHIKSMQQVCIIKTILLSTRQMSSNYLESSKENVLGEYDAVTLSMLYLRVFHDMVSQNS